MAWDSSRPVPWKRLIREGVIFLVLGSLIFALFIKGTNAGTYVGLVAGMALFVGFSAILAKFGYSRQSLKEARAATAAKQASGGRSSGRGATTTASSVARQRPAPTKRTSTGPSQRPNRKRR